MVLSTALYQVLPVGNPGITAQQVVNRVGDDVPAVEVERALRRLVVDGAAISDDAEGATTYRCHDEDEQP